MIALLIISLIIFYSAVIIIAWGLEEILSVWKASIIVFLFSISFVLAIIYVGNDFYREGQIDYSKGIIEYEQRIETDTTYVKIK